eukprot:3105430-Prymnesium_polylepis.4
MQQHSDDLASIQYLPPVATATTTCPQPLRQLQSVFSLLDDLQRAVKLSHTQAGARICAPHQRQQL